MVLPALCDLHSSARLKFPRELLRDVVPSVTARQAVPLQRFALAHNSQTSISTHHLKKLGQLLKSQAIKTLKCLLAAQVIILEAQKKYIAPVRQQQKHAHD